MKKKGKDIADELRQIAPDMPQPGDMPDSGVPVGYFEGFPEQLMARIRQEEEELSPFMASLPRTMPFTVPEGYFEALPAEIVTRRQAKIIPMRRTLYRRGLVAALITGVIGVTAILLFRSGGEQTLDKQLAQVSNQEIMDYLQFNTDAFDNDNIFANVSLEENTPALLPEELTAEDVDMLLEENILKETPLNQ